MNSSSRNLGPLAAAGALVVLISACGGTSSAAGDGQKSGPRNGGGVVKVVASTNVYGDIVRQIAGDHADVTSIISDPAQDPHSYEANATTQLELSKADLVIENGGGYDDFVDSMLKTAGNDSTTLINVVELSQKTAPTGGELNEHVWYDFLTMQKLSDAVAAALADALPADAATFSSNAAKFTTQLDGLEKQEATIKAAHEGTGVAITEPVPLYLLDASGLVNKTPPAFSEAIEEGTDVPVAVLSQTLELFRTGEVKVLAYNEQTAGPETEKVLAAARSSDVAVVPVTETLPDGKDYLSWMTGNLQALSFLRGVWVRPGWELLPVRALFFGLFAVLTVAGAYAAAHYRRSAEWAPDAQWPVPPASDGRTRHPAEWLLPLVLTSVVLAAFIAVQITALFGGDDLIRRETGLTYADRAHEGFGQLIAVTVLMAALLGWAGRIAAAGSSAHRRMLALAGGVLLTLTILLALSALRRLWLYQSAYGWTIRRLLAGSFEIWLAAMLLGLALVWVMHRTDLTPRLVLGSAGLGILCLALAGPDAIVVHADVIGYRSTGNWDMEYIAHLSADAVPALGGLPEPMRTRALTAWQNEHRTEFGAAPGEGDGWAAWSLSRWRACRMISC